MWRCLAQSLAQNGTYCVAVIKTQRSDSGRARADKVVFTECLPRVKLCVSAHVWKKKKKREKQAAAALSIPHTMQQGVWTENKTHEASPHLSYPILMLRLRTRLVDQKQLQDKSWKSWDVFIVSKIRVWIFFQCSLPSNTPNTFDFLPCWTPNTAVLFFWHPARLSEHCDSDSVTHVRRWFHQ